MLRNKTVHCGITWKFWVTDNHGENIFTNRKFRIRKTKKFSLFQGSPRRQKRKRMFRSFYKSKKDKILNGEQNSLFFLHTQVSSWIFIPGNVRFLMETQNVFTSSDVCDETKGSSCLILLLNLNFSISRIPLTHMRLSTLLILTECRTCAKYERREQLSPRWFFVALWLCDFVQVFRIFRSPVLLFFHVLGFFCVLYILAQCLIIFLVQVELCIWSVEDYSGLPSCASEED